MATPSFSVATDLPQLHRLIRHATKRRLRNLFLFVSLCNSFEMEFMSLLFLATNGYKKKKRKKKKKNGGGQEKRAEPSTLCAGPTPFH
ncbi:hypothetical protein OUZ56_010602 [Daphnia magna]|uniref:Uncharacterized protein n=1 Tax=Daphnia magna TaxID=35525 RepID=A0ABR0AJ01_9CRUS|nr:hypothetical protein OUZ56_010602 [Daphnia magna]